MYHTLYKMKSSLCSVFDAFRRPQCLFFIGMSFALTIMGIICKHLYSYSGRFPANRPKWVHFYHVLPHSAKKSPFPGIRKAGRGRTLSGQMTLFFHFFPSEGVFLSIQPYILTFYQPKYAKTTTQASYQNLGGYMAPPMGIEPMILP